MKNNKGFTLVELLATVTILGIIMLIAVPNILGTVERNKRTTYIEDAKKLVSLAENKMRSDTTLIKPTTGCGIIYTLEELDNGDLSEPPEGGEYSQKYSFVVITYDNSLQEYVYRVQLFENVKKGSSELRRGIYVKTSSTSDSKYNSTTVINSKDLKSDLIELVQDGFKDNDSTRDAMLGGVSQCGTEKD